VRYGTLLSVLKSYTNHPPKLYTALYARVGSQLQLDRDQISMESCAYETNKMEELFDYGPDLLSDRASFQALIDIQQTQECN
jgi:hypothetical protein